MNVQELISESKRLLAEEQRITALQQSTEVEIAKVEHEGQLDDSEALTLLSALRTRRDLCPVKLKRVQDEIKQLREQATKAVMAEEGQGH